MKYEVVCTQSYLDVGLLIELNKDQKPKRVLARASTYGTDIEYGGVEILTWVGTGILLSKQEWIEISYNKYTDQILDELGISKKPIEMSRKNDFKFCPFMINKGNGRCIGEDCSWWCKWANDCSVPLLAGMFADSTVCQSVFDNAGDNI